MLRRLWHVVVDLLDAIVTSLLYGGQGGLTYTTTRLEAENQERLRNWADLRERP